MTEYLVIKSPHHLSDLHLLLHPWLYLLHCPAIRLSKVMWNKNILTHENRYVLKVLGIQHEIEHGNLIAMVLNYWFLMYSLTWNQSQRKMNLIVNFVIDAVETETGSNYATPENVMHMGYCWGHCWHQLCMPLHQW